MIRTAPNARACGPAAKRCGCVAALLCVLCGEASAMSRLPRIETFADGIPASAEQILVDVYQRAGQRIARMVTDPTGGTASARKFNRARAAALGTQIDGVLREVKGFTAAWAPQAAGSAFARGLRDANGQLAAAGVRLDPRTLTGSFSLIDRRTVAVIAADMAISLDAALTDQARSARRFLRAISSPAVADSRVSEIVAAGAVSGDVAATYKAMRKAIADGAVATGELRAADAESYRRAGRQIITVGAAQMTVRRYAEMLVRTRTRQATVQARHERLIQHDVRLVSIVGALSENFCTAYLGRVFSIDGSDDRYPALSELPGGGPPFHPNCSKSTRAYIERFASTEQKRQGHTTDDRFVTTDQGEAQAVFDAKGELHNVARRYRTTA